MKDAKRFYLIVCSVDYSLTVRNKILTKKNPLDCFDYEEGKIIISAKACAAIIILN